MVREEADDPKYRPERTGGRTGADGGADKSGVTVNDGLVVYPPRTSTDSLALQRQFSLMICRFYRIWNPIRV